MHHLTLVLHKMNGLSPAYIREMAHGELGEYQKMLTAKRREKLDPFKHEAQRVNLEVTLQETRKLIHFLPN